VRIIELFVHSMASLHSCCFWASFRLWGTHQHWNFLMFTSLCEMAETENWCLLIVNLCHGFHRSSVSFSHSCDCLSTSLFTFRGIFYP